MILEDKNTDFDLWCTEKCDEQPTFKYWYMIKKIVLQYLVMLKSIRDGDFDSYKSSLSAIMPYFFANDNTHFSRWGTIHLHDMLSLHENSPSIYNEFLCGNFVLHESHRIFLLLLLIKHMNITTDLSNQMVELLGLQKKKQLFCAG